MRLERGDPDRETVFAEDSVEVARRWVAEGARMLHVVDLDGAFLGEPCHLAEVASIVRESDASVELGGGLRTFEAVEEALACGVSRVVLGTRAANDPGFLEGCARRWPGQVAAAVDAREGHVAVNGWRKMTGKKWVDLVAELAAVPLAAVVFTAVESDGMMSGPDFEAIREVVQATEWPVIASGGISSVDHIRRLREMEPLGLSGVIVGRALYTGHLSLPQAILAGGES